MRPKGFDTIVSHFAEVLPRRAFDALAQGHEGMNREVAQKMGINDATLPGYLRASGVAIVDVTRTAIRELVEAHGINTEDTTAIDTLNSFLLENNNPFIQPVRELLGRALAQHQDRHHDQ